VQDIIDACREYADMTSRRVTFEYCLLGGVNDSDELAHELVKLLRRVNCHVNIIPYNAVDGAGFKAPGMQRVEAFDKILDDAGIRVTQRVQRGPDIAAACGQLRRRVGQS